MQRVGQPQVQVGIAKPRMELYRGLVPTGQLQRLEQQEVDQRLVGQPLGRGIGLGLLEGQAPLLGEAGGDQLEGPSLR